jgi:glycosyltransferase involved in cell wall biosynthesis
MDGGRIAIVHDWLDTWRGGENVLAEIVAEYPQADLFALVDFLPQKQRARILGKKAHTSFVQRLPGARRHFRRYLPLFPAAIESLDLAGYDLVISNSHAFAKGARVAPHQVHVCYCNTPMRYAWDLREQYLSMTGLGRGLRGALVRPLLDRLREWDRRTAVRVDRFAANSHYIAERIRRAYGRESTVIYPPVDVQYFSPEDPAIAPRRREYHVTASRWVPYKRVDLIVAAFAQMRRPLVVVGEGPEDANVRRHARANTTFAGEVSRERLRALLRGARAFVFAAEEDFGILPVEAQACGTPVIAYGRGGALETVSTKEPRTGQLFDTQSAEAIADAVERFERDVDAFDAVACRLNAERFGIARFRAELRAFVSGSAHDTPQKAAA